MISKKRLDELELVAYTSVDAGNEMRELLAELDTVYTHLEAQTEKAQEMHRAVTLALSDIETAWSPLFVLLEEDWS